MTTPDITERLKHSPLKHAAEAAATIAALRREREEMVAVLERSRGYLEWHADEDGPTDCPPCARMLADIDALLARLTAESGQ